MNKILADMHVHTVLSQHGHSTVKENVTAAIERGLTAIAVTDHLFLPEDPISAKQIINGSCNVSRHVKGLLNMSVLSGAEGNIGQCITLKGQADRINAECAWRLIGFHRWVGADIHSPGDFLCEIEKSLRGEDGYICPTAIGHIERLPFYADDIKKAISLCCEVVSLANANGVYMEVNEHSLDKNQRVDIMAGWLRHARDTGAMLVLGSDAHYCDEVGNFSKVITMLESVGADRNYILNCDMDGLNEFVADQKQRNAAL